MSSEIKSALNAGEAGINPLPCPENTPAGESGRISGPSVADSAARAIGRDIRLKRRVIRKLEVNERAALRDIAKRGAAVIDKRCDSHGKPVDKLVPNPNLRVARECRSAIAALKKEITGLEAAQTQAAPKEMSKLENLAARAKGLRG
jgi:hypothetical protein